MNDDEQARIVATAFDAGYRDGHRADLAAHPAMLARDAALVQQGRDEVAAAVETVAQEFSCREAAWHDNARHDSYAEGARDAYDLAEQIVRAAVAAAGASDLATIRAEAWDEGHVHGACDVTNASLGIGYGPTRNPYRVAAEAGERQ